MKLVKIHTGDIKTFDVIKSVMERPPQSGGGITIAIMRARCRVLDALDGSVAGAGDQPLLLEDADHKTLVEALQTFPFGVASRELLAVIDDILDAKEPPPPPAQELPAADAPRPA